MMSDSTRQNKSQAAVPEISSKGCCAVPRNQSAVIHDSPSQMTPYLHIRIVFAYVRSNCDLNAICLVCTEYVYIYICILHSESGLRWIWMCACACVWTLKAGWFGFLLHCDRCQIWAKDEIWSDEWPFFHLHLRLYLHLHLCLNSRFRLCLLLREDRCSSFLQFPSCQNSIECGHVLQTYVSVEQLFNAQLIHLNGEKQSWTKVQFHKISDPSLQFIGIRVAILCNRLKKQRRREKEKKKKTWSIPVWNRQLFFLISSNFVLWPHISIIETPPPSHSPFFVPHSSAEKKKKAIAHVWCIFNTPPFVSLPPPVLNHIFCWIESEIVESLVSGFWFCVSTGNVYV